MKTVPTPNDVSDLPTERPRRRAFEAARHEWPRVELTFEQFCHHLDRLGHRDDLPPYAGAVYLCAACVEQKPMSYETLEATFFPTLAQTLKRMSIDSSEDVLQDLRRRLLAESPPKIATYRGRGPLAAWLRTAAINVALDHRRSSKSHQRHRRQIQEWSQATGLGPGAEGLEEGLFERRCAQIFDRGLRAGVQALSPEARRLLHLHVVHGLSIDILANLYSIHRATVARRVRRHLDSLGAHILALLASEVGELSARELSHVAQLWHRYSEFTPSGIFLSSATPLDGESPTAATVADDTTDSRPRIGRPKATSRLRERRSESAADTTCTDRP